MTITWFQQLKIQSLLGTKYLIGDLCKLVILYGFFCEKALKIVLLDFLVTVKAAPHGCVIRTGQP